MEKIEKKEFQQVSIIKMNNVAKFHKKTIFDDIRGHFLILPFYRALTRASEGLLRKKAVKFEVKVLHTPIFHRIRLYDDFKSKKILVACGLVTSR